MEPILTVTKQKDPKKVAAGLAGANARKAKQAHLIEELRKAKESLQDVSKKEESNENQEEVHVEPNKSHVESNKVVKYIPWILGGVLGLVYLFSQRATIKTPVKSDAHQLKLTHNPFYME